MWTYDDEFSVFFLNLNKILKNSTPGKVACIWHIERVQIDEIKFKRTQIHLFTDVVILAYGPYSLLLSLLFLLLFLLLNGHDCN